MFINSKTEQSCLSVWNIGDGVPDCSTNVRDEYHDETNEILKHKKCDSRKSLDCKYLREYIAQSSKIISTKSTSSNNETIVEYTKTEIKFWSFCDSIWNMNNGLDERNCSEWKCISNYPSYQCQTGQCIPLNWLCNREWDYSDGSDEEGFQLLTESTMGDYNRKMFQSQNWNLIEKKEECFKTNSPQPFRNLCNYKNEYPCLLANVEDSWNFKLNHPCINLTQLSDGQIDCYGGLDERNLINYTSTQQLGYSFKRNNSNILIEQLRQCSSKNRCPNNGDRFYGKN